MYLKKSFSQNAAGRMVHLLHNQLLAPVPNGDLSLTWTSPSLKIVFLSFISKAKHDQALPSHVRGKFWIFELQQRSLCNFWDTLYI